MLRRDVRHSHAYHFPGRLRQPLELRGPALWPPGVVQSGAVVSGQKYPVLLLSPVSRCESIH
jgi:hypothetical protein